MGSQNEEQPSRAKRARVALACQRCKSRKQKCDGAFPTCFSCRSLVLHCEYIVPQKPVSFGKNRYINALENRVCELETHLAQHGLGIEAQDHWNRALPLQHQRIDGSYATKASARKASPVNSCNPEYSSGQVDRQTEVDIMVNVLRDLSLEANGGYVGGSSNITVGRMVTSMLQGREQSNSTSTSSQIGGNSSPRSMFRAEEEALSSPSLMVFVTDEISERLFKGYIKHISTRWPVLHSIQIEKLLARRHDVKSVYDKCIIHLVYALGGRFIETTGEMGDFLPEEHHKEAMKLLDEILRYQDSRSAIVLFLLAVYSLRASKGPGAWTYVGQAIRICIDLGLHRRTPSMNKLSHDNEMKKRLFWACYCLDRQVSIPHGRPFAISDCDIDVPLPLDVDEEADDITLQEAAAKIVTTQTPAISTSLSSFVHVIRLRRIESSIQQTIYRVDRPASYTDDDIENYLQQLVAWRAAIPSDVFQKVDVDPKPYDGPEYYLVFYYKCIRFLLYPQLSRPQINPRFLKLCAEACGGVCQTYKRLHQIMSVGYSFMALQTVFLAGLNLIYCCWLSPQEIWSIKASNDIHACSIMLYVITERRPGARKYRDVFEVVKQGVVDLIAEGKHQTPQRAITILQDAIQPSLQNLDIDNSSKDELSNIVTHISGCRGSKRAHDMSLDNDSLDDRGLLGQQLEQSLDIVPFNGEMSLDKNFEDQNIFSQNMFNDADILLDNDGFFDEI